MNILDDEIEDIVLNSDEIDDSCDSPDDGPDNYKDVPCRTCSGRGCVKCKSGEWVDCIACDGRGTERLYL